MKEEIKEQLGHLRPLIIILLAFIAIITTCGLVSAAKADPIYWPAVLSNLLVYACLLARRWRIDTNK